MAEATKKTVDTGGKDLPVVVRRPFNPMRFGREVWRDGIEKVTWPSWKETWLTSTMVFIMVGLTMVFFFGIDKLLEYGERLLVGAS